MDNTENNTNEPEKPIEKINKLKIINKDLNQIDFLNFQHYYDLIKHFKKENINISTDFINNIRNINYLYQKQRISPLSIKLRKDMKNISQHIYHNNNINKNEAQEKNKKNFMSQYNYIINSVKSVTPKKYNSKKNFSLKKNYPIKVYHFQDKENNCNKINDSINKEKIRNNTVDSYLNDDNNNKTRIKFNYENYALNISNYNHPQFYILNNNNTINKNNNNSKEKLPLIETSNGFKFRRSGDLSSLIPYNTKKRKVRDNFYSYYIGMKLSKNNY